MAETNSRGMALFAAGSALSIFGQMQANADQANAEIQNSLWLEQQSAFARESARREEDIFEGQVGDIVAEQIGGFAANNVALSGSALDVIHNTFDKAISEVEAIRLQGFMQAKEADLKSGAARRKAEQLSSFTNQFLQASGTALTASARFA